MPKARLKHCLVYRGGSKRTRWWSLWALHRPQSASSHSVPGTHCPHCRCYVGVWGSPESWFFPRRSLASHQEGRKVSHRSTPATASAYAEWNEREGTWGDAAARKSCRFRAVPRALCFAPIHAHAVLWRYCAVLKVRSLEYLSVHAWKHADHSHPYRGSSRGRVQLVRKVHY